MPEQRRYARWCINCNAKLKLAGAQADAECCVRDISLLGAQIALRIKLPKDTFVKFNLSLSSEHILEVEAWVVWQRKIEPNHIYGFYFSKIKDMDKEKIYQFLRRNFPAQISERCWQGRRVTQEGGEVMKQTEFRDKRVFERFPANFPVRLIHPNAPEEVQAKARDISAKGIGIISNIALANDTPLEIWLDIPDEAKPLYSRGKVVWSKPLNENECCSGINLDKADLMGVARVLRTK